MLAGFAYTLLFLVATIAQIIVSLLVLGYASHCYLVMLSETAGGNDEVVWPDDPWIDWAWKLVYMLGLLAFWLVPAGAVLQTLVAADSLSGWTATLILLGVFWIVFPVSVLSSMGAAHRWVVLYGKVIAGLLRHPGALLVYYVVRGVLLAACAGLLYKAESPTDGLPILMPVAALALATSLFIDARLLGRVALLSSYEKRGRGCAAKKKRPVKGVKAADPWAAPAGEPAPAKLPVKRRRKAPDGDTYAVTDEPATPPVEHQDPFGERVEAYGLAPPEAPPVAPPPSVPEAPADEPAATEPEGRPRRPAPPASRKPPLEKRPLLAGVFGAPWQPRTVPAWCGLSFGFLLIVGLLWLQVALFPF
jgi:hypothetical protein